jgi:DNA-directed RNA polymerase specialized sigma24 family protein
VGNLDRNLLPSPSVEAPATLVPRAELAEVIARDGSLLDAVRGWAMDHTRHPQNAEDLYADTLTHALDPRYQAWEREQYPTAGAFLGSVMNGLARNRRRSSSAARRADLDEQNVTHPRRMSRSQLAPKVGS